MAATQHPRLRLKTLTALMTAVAALAACGGGDDAATTPPAPPPPPVAPAPPPPPVVSLPFINSPPQGTTLDEGDITTLVVGANDGGGTLSYQWFLNDQPIAGATSDQITTTPLPFILSGSASLAYKVRVTNSAGSVDSAVATVATNGVARSWRDVGNIDPFEAERQSSGEPTTAMTASGRVWVLGVGKDVAGAGSAGLIVTGISADNSNEVGRWAGVTTVPGFVSNGSIDDVAVAASASGHLLAVFTVYSSNPLQGEASNQVRATLYTPNADPALPGIWADLGNLTDASFETKRAAVASTGPGEFEVVWLQNDPIQEVDDLIARRYTVPATGQPLTSGWGGRDPVENNSSSVDGTPVLIGGLGKSLVIFYDTNAGQARYQYNLRAAGASWDAASVVDAQLNGSDRTRPVHAVNSAGMVALVTRNPSGRAYTRRFDLASGNYFDSSWEYNANAYGSDPAVLIDEAGRIDVFGVSVNTAAGNPSVLGHWTFDPAPSGGWGAANILVSDSGDWLAGAGIRDPQAGRDAAGNFVLAWRQPVNGTQALQSLRYSAVSQAWASSPTLVVPQGSSATYYDGLSLAVSPSGAATLAWQQELGSDNRIQRARLR
jgi:hypothetical protein